ncbi:hypothetical protein FRC07_004497 [Ceratobasidium sp. 392]|nr:hypothetical protein FRC07_004497 [Ceratobasidium sp. 392]
MSLLSWKCALVTGGGGGLGKAFAQSLVKRGKTVYLAGRTESNLVATAKEIGAVGYFVVDVGDIASLPAFVEKVIKEVPDVDCVLNNAGIQNPLDFANSADLNAADQEININVTGLVHLCALFVPHLKQKDNACIMNVTSGLGYVPSKHVPVYSATKAFVHSFTLSLREQLRSCGIAVIEISPPLVESDLHRSWHETYEAAVNSGRVTPMTQEEWMKAVDKGWDEGKEEIVAGFSAVVLDKWREALGPAHAQMNKS